MPRIFCADCATSLARVSQAVLDRLPERFALKEFRCPNGCKPYTDEDDEVFTPSVPDLDSKPLPFVRDGVIQHAPPLRDVSKPHERDAQELSLPWDHQSANPDYPE